MDLGRQRLLPRSLTEADVKSLIEYMWRDVDCTKATPPSPRDSRFLAIRNVAMIEILFATGIRVGELASLTCQDWREDEASFLITGKGLRQRVALLPDQRSQRAIRTYLKHRATLSLGHDSLLVNAAGRKLSSQGIARTITLAAKNCGIKARVTPHMIRHTVATLLLRCGADIRIVQEVLGHASIITTQRYTYVSKEHLTSTLKTLHPNHHINIELPGPADAQLLLPLV
jgi:site-specific recombinase XerD